MADIFSKKKRSEIMAAVSREDTKPEVIVRKYLFDSGFRYLKNDRRYPGTPDIVLPKYDTVIFVHGCFWHNHNCRAGRLPESNREYWKNKMKKNKERDSRKRDKLKKEGWNVLTVWECEIKNKSNRLERLDELESQIRKNLNDG